MIISTGMFIVSDEVLDFMITYNFHLSTGLMFYSALLSSNLMKTAVNRHTDCLTSSCLF